MAQPTGDHFLDLMNAFKEDPEWAKSLWDGRSDVEYLQTQLEAHGLESGLVAHLQDDDTWSSLAHLSTQVLGQPHTEIN